jgi:hypothetical protein
MNWDHKDSKNPPTYRIHGVERRILKKERSDIMRHMRHTWSSNSMVNTLKMINKLLDEPYGMVSYQVKEHTLNK